MHQGPRPNVVTGGTYMGNVSPAARTKPSGPAFANVIRYRSGRAEVIETPADAVDGYMCAERALGGRGAATAAQTVGLGDEGRDTYQSRQ